MRGQPEESKPNGLVICSISDRSETSKIEKELNQATQKFPKVERRSINSNQPDYYFEVSPASIQLSRKEAPKPNSGNYSTRKAITVWSKKSRSNMLKVLFSLDYSELFADDLRTPVMITLTYPGDWETVAPNGQSVKRHLSIFRKRFLRAYGEAFNGVWKLEFQRRGAPHIHILSSVKTDLGLFQLWVSKTWADIVNHPDAKQKEKHQNAGTQVQAWYDFFRDKPYLIAHYFGKHSSPNKGGVKEYQNKPPALWIDSGSIGRFWGYWGIEPAKSKVRLSREDSLFIQRTLRRWHEANSQPKKARVRRVNHKTGVISYRWVMRKHKRLTHQGGFISVPSGAGMTEKLLAALQAKESCETAGTASTSSRSINPKMSQETFIAHETHFVRFIAKATTFMRRIIKRVRGKPT